MTRDLSQFLVGFALLGLAAAISCIPTAQTPDAGGDAAAGFVGVEVPLGWDAGRGGR